MHVISIFDPLAITLATSALSRGELVIYPTETCYGLGADSNNPEAITKLLAYKGDRYRQVAIAVDSIVMARKFVSLNELANNIYTHLLPGPITVISKSHHKLDTRLESSSGDLGIRYPRHDFALSLITSLGSPITATSANTSGKKEPYSLEDWQTYTTPSKQLEVSLFLDAGKLADRPTSTVIDTTQNDPLIVRQGEITFPDLANQSYTSDSVEDTVNIAGVILKKHLSLTKSYPLIIALQGPLGVGKTHFTQGMASFLGIVDNVNSPTYTLLKEYIFKTPKYAGMLYHLDTWRLREPGELESSLHVSTLLKPGNIIALEWPQKAQEILKLYKDTSAIIYIDLSENGISSRFIKYQLSIPDWS